MDKVGSYEILDDLYLTEHGAVSRAERTDGVRGVFVVKRFTKAVEDPSEPQWELQTFLDRARVQQMLAAGGATHWAPIHELGIDGDSAYYATDYIPVSAQKLIDAKLTPKSSGLHTLVLGCIKGLSELLALRNRPHGDLKPSNVLIGGQDLSTAPILLTDPASNAQAAKVGEAGDLRSIGELIHQLVLHRPHDPAQWPLPAASEWGALGKLAEKWRRLCSDLLNPDPGARPRLPEISQRLGTMRARRRMRFRKVLTTLVVLLVLGTIGVVVLSCLDYAARMKYAQAKHDWFGRFVDAASDPRRQKYWKSDPDLQRILAELPIAKLSTIDTDEPPLHDWRQWRRLVRWKYHEFADVLDALATVQTIQDELPAHWQKASHAEELRQRLLARGWTQPADYLAQLMEGTHPGPKARVAGAIDRLLAAYPTVESGLALSDSEWKKFTDQIHMVRTTNDPVLMALAEMLMNSASSGVHLSETGFSGLDGVQSDAALAEQLNKVLADTYPANVDKEPFDKEVAKTFDARHVKKEDVGRWVKLVSSYAYRNEEKTAAAEELRKRLQETIELITHADISPDERGKFETARRDASIAIADFEQLKFSQRTLEDGTFARRRDEARNKIEAIRRFYHPEGPEEWLNALPAVATASDAINGRWEAWRKVLRDDLPQMTANRSVFKDRQRASEQLRSLLVALDQGFPPAPPVPNDSFMALARKRREQTLRRLLPLIDLSAPTLPDDALKSATSQYSQFTSNLIALSHDFPINRQIIGPNDHVDEAWKKKPEFWLDPEIQALVKNDVARLGRVTALRTASREELAKAISGGGEAEIALEAWRVLGDSSIHPTWPANTDELTAEFRFRQRVAATFKTLRDPAEADIPNKELAEQGPIRWRQFVEHATSESMVQTAWNLAPSFGMEAKEVAKLSPVARYNLYLGCLNEAIAAGDDEAVRTDLTALSKAATALKDRPGIADLPARLARMVVKEPFADQVPGDLFSLTLPGTDKSVQFKRIEPPSGRPFYLCMTDVSVGQFIATLDATRAWAQARQLSWPYEFGKRDVRRGPRTWEWGGTAASPMTVPQLWLTPDEFNDYPPIFRLGKFNRTALSDAVGGNPSTDHPIQYISGEVAMFFAGICGCRLASPSEWQTVFSTVENNVAIDGWNLRDQTWEVQRRYVAANSGGHWPDEGCFSAGTGTSPAGPTATSRPGNDHILYFQSVDANRGNVFHHLAGNVAQFVCDANDAFDRANDRHTAAGIRSFLDQYPKSLYVIGGSALSAPDVPLDKPLAVTSPQDAYADVGIRLAFTAPSRTLAEKAKWVMGTPPYFWPK